MDVASLLRDALHGSGTRSPRRIFGSLLVAAAAVSALTGYHGSTTTSQQHDTTSYLVRGHVRTLVVTAHVGDVQVSGDTGGAVSVTQHLVFDGSKPSTTHRVEAGTLSLTSHCEAGEVCSVSYDITVPRATAVQVTDDVGTVRLSGLAGQVAVLVDAGRVDLSALSGPVEATTRAGSITGRQLSSPRASLRVPAGEIDVAFSAPPTTVIAATDIGPITLRIPNSVPYHVAAKAAAGHVTVTVIQSTAASRMVTATTKLGSITIEP
ncbi:MAG: hypothetical protein WBH47_03065 [Streptosporangiaceae bacterium]